MNCTLPDGLALMKYQEEGVQFLVDRNRALLASDPGTGKTVMLIVAAITAAAIKKTRIKILVLCPKSMRLTWVKEIAKWAGSADVDWTVKNWDRLLTKSDSYLLQTAWDVVIGDESHCAIKNADTVRCKLFLKNVVPKSTRVWLATATPASKSAVDYFATLQILVPDWTKQWTKWTFQKQFCQAIPDRFAASGFKYDGFKNGEILRTVFSKCALRHRKAEVLPQLPPITHTEIILEIDKKVAAECLEVDAEYVAELIAAGKPLPGHIAHVMQACAIAKVEQTVEWMMNYPEDEPLIVFAWHRKVIEAITEKLAKEKVLVETITGAVTNENIRQNIVDKFQQGKVKRLVMNMQSGGVGLTLTAARTAVYIEFPHSLIHWIQSMNRIHRIGTQHTNIQIVRMLGNKTIDQVIFNKLQSKMLEIEKVGV